MTSKEKKGNEYKICNKTVMDNNTDPNITFDVMEYPIIFKI